MLLMWVFTVLRETYSSSAISPADSLLDRYRSTTCSRSLSGTTSGPGRDARPAPPGPGRPGRAPPGPRRAPPPGGPGGRGGGPEPLQQRPDQQVVGVVPVQV